MSKTSYIDLASFRKSNGINQSELADFLGTSRSFISLIETGVNKLPADKLEMILASAPSKHWHIDELLPHLDRLKKLDQELTNRGVTRINKNPLNLTDEAYRGFQSGRLGFTEQFADEIVNDIRYKSRYININRSWLLTGEGEMILPESIEQLANKVRDLERVVDSFRERLRTIEREQMRMGMRTKSKE